MPLVNEHSALSKSKSFRINRQAISEPIPSQSKFPRIEDCAHFHYETVDHGSIKLLFVDESSTKKTNRIPLVDDLSYSFSIKITCKNKSWIVRRNLIHFQTLDLWLHQCVFDRKYSNLPMLKAQELRSKPYSEIETELRHYLKRLSEMTGCNASGWQIFCAPVLHWLELDNHGRNLVAHALGDVADINIPAVAAARVVRRYQAQDEGELSLNVGDMVSIIEMTTNGWWRGKQGLKVGSFPSQCVKRISRGTDIDSATQRGFVSPKSEAEQNMPITRKHGKLMFRLRSFLDTRPSKSVLKKRGIFRERVFGCDLGELLHKTGEEVPTIVSDCTKFIEKHGLVDGIYRISGVASHVRHLRYEFDSDKRPDLENIEGLPDLSALYALADHKTSMCDPHSVAGLCKLYFRELPNPLLTYQLYDRFASALTDYDAEERLLKVYDAIQHLPPPHYRTLKHLVTHLRTMAGHDKQTSMHSRNLAIVWAPNLLRSHDIEAGLAALTEARVQSVVAEFIIVNGDLLFSEKLQNKQFDAVSKPPRPRSLMILPTPKLISLEEAQARSKSGLVSPVYPDSTSPSRVEMREWSDKPTSERRKRRHKKSTSISITYSSTSPRLARASQKQGLRHTRSVYDANLSVAKSFDLELDCPPATKQASGHKWRTKLGSILKKSTPTQATVPCEVTLRRTQSADSLISLHSLKKHFRNSDPLLDHKKSLSESSTTAHINISSEKSNPKGSGSDRSRPEPQVSCSKVRSPSSVLVRNKSRSPPKNRRSATVGESSPVKRRETFQITFRKVSPKNISAHPPSQPAPFDLLSAPKDVEASPNPFSEFSDFPTIMGESGLGFDPMKYQTSPDRSPLWHDVIVPPFKPSEEESTSQLQSRIKEISHFAPPADPLLGDMILSTVPPPMIADDSEPSSESLPCVNGPQSGAQEQAINQNANNNVSAIVNFSTRSNSPLKLSSTVPSKSSDRKEKGNTPRKVNGPKVKAKSTRKQDKSKNGHESCPPHDWKPDRHQGISVQVYDVVEGDPLKRNSHYGSFIALVGSTNDPPHQIAPSVDIPAKSKRLEPKPRKLSSPEQSKLLTGVSRNYRDDKKQLDQRNDSGFRQNSSREIFSPRLDSFNPEGRQRFDYRETVLSPRYESSRSTRSGSIDSELPLAFDHSFKLSDEIHDCIFETRNVAQTSSTRVYPNNPGPPEPAPRKHVRSFSVDDELLERCRENVQLTKPKPLPRASLQQHPATKPDSRIRHSAGYAYDNRTYEAWKQARSQSHSDDEVLTSRDPGCLRKMKVRCSSAHDRSWKGPNRGPSATSPQNDSTGSRNPANQSPDYFHGPSDSRYHGSIISYIP